MSYSGKSVLITGASSGIGAEFARQFHARGAELILSARRENLLNDLTSVFNAARKNSCRYIVADLTLEEDLKKVCQHINESRVDILVNNAGFGSLGYFHDLDIKHEVTMLKLNIIATTEILHSVLAQMKNRKSGNIISVSSVAAFHPMPFMSTYAATKAYNFHHSLGLRRELADLNINISVLCPGPTETEFFGAAKLSGLAKKMRRDNVADVVKSAISGMEHRKAYIVTGLRSKLMALAAGFLPISLSTWAISKVLKPKARNT